MFLKSTTSNVTQNKKVAKSGSGVILPPLLNTTFILSFLIISFLVQGVGMHSARNTKGIHAYTLIVFSREEKKDETKKKSSYKKVGYGTGATHP